MITIDNDKYEQAIIYLEKVLKNDTNILDVYTTRFNDLDDNKSMDINEVTNCIYNSFVNEENELIMDGRPSAFRN